MKCCNYNYHMIIRLYINCDYNNTLYYMLLDQVIADEGTTEIYLIRIVTTTSYGVFILYYLLFIHQVKLDCLI